MVELQGREDFFAAGGKRSGLTREAVCAGKRMVSLSGKKCLYRVEAGVKGFWVEVDGCRFGGGGKSSTDYGEGSGGGGGAASRRGGYFSAAGVIVGEKALVVVCV